MTSTTRLIIAPAQQRGPSGQATGNHVTAAELAALDGRSTNFHNSAYVQTWLPDPPGASGRPAGEGWDDLVRRDPLAGDIDRILKESTKK